MAEGKIVKIIDEYNREKERQSQWMEHYEDLAQVHLPFALGFSSAVVEGEQRGIENFDGTPMQGARSLANNVGFFLRPENQEWIRMRIEDDSINDTDEGKRWVNEALERFINAIRQPAARFRQATGEVDTDLVVFGTGLLFIGANRRRDGFIFQSLGVKHTIPLYNEDGTVRGMFNCKQWEIQQAAERFGKNKLSRQSQEAIRQNKGNQKISILHGIMPRENGDPNAILARNLPIRDIWIELDAKLKLEEGGFHEMPIVAPRWDTTSGENMGRSPAMVALADSNTLQAMGETVLVSGQRAADPPLLAPNDGSFSEINTFPGGISYYDIETASLVNGNPFFPLNSSVNLPITRDMQVDTRGQVLAAFFRNILNLPVDGPQMTATEVIQRKDEFIREVGPVFGRFETDYTAPMVERAFNIMLRSGGFPPIPEILQGQNLRFEFESPITKIRQQIRAAAAQLWVQEQLEISKFDPSARDLVNFDAYARFRADSSSVPNEIINDKGTVNEIRKARAEAQQAAQEAEQQALGAQNIEKFASAAGKIAQAGKSVTEAKSSGNEEQPVGA